MTTPSASLAAAPRSPMTASDWAFFLQSYQQHLSSLIETNRNRIVGFLGTMGGILATFAFLDLRLFFALVVATSFFVAAHVFLWRKRWPEHIPAYVLVLLGLLMLGVGGVSLLGLFLVSSTSNPIAVTSFVVMVLGAAVVWLLSNGWVSAFLQVATLMPLAVALDRYSWSVAGGTASDMSAVSSNVDTLMDSYWVSLLRANWFMTRTLLGQDRTLLRPFSWEEQERLLDCWVLRKHGNRSFAEYVEIHRQEATKSSPSGRPPSR